MDKKLTDEELSELVRWTPDDGLKPMSDRRSALIELQELRAAKAADVERMRYWKQGTEIIEKCLAVSLVADPADVPFPLVGDEAKLWHSASASAYQHALEMMAQVKDIATPTVRSGGLTYEQCDQAAANFGIDMKCGSCASIFYTGFGGYSHDAACKTIGRVHLNHRQLLTMKSLRERLSWQSRPFDGDYDEINVLDLLINANKPPVA